MASVPEILDVEDSEAYYFYCVDQCTVTIEKVGAKERESVCVCVAVCVNGTICEYFLCQKETKKIEFSSFLFGRSSVPSFNFKVQEEGIIFCKTFPLEKLFDET